LGDMKMEQGQSLTLLLVGSTAHQGSSFWQ
jgi:hypothetical protein